VLLLTEVVLLSSRGARYTAGVDLLVQPVPTTNADQAANYYDILGRGQVTDTYAQLLDNSRNIAGVLANAQLPRTDQLAVRVTPIAGTSLLRVTATADSRTVAELAANTVAEAGPTAIQLLRDPYQAKVVGTAVGTAMATSSPTSAYMVVGVTVAMAAGLAVQQLLRRLRSSASGEATASISRGP